MKNIYPAPHYTPCADLWVITPYYNPAGYRTRRENHEQFAAPIRSAGIPLITVEAAFGPEPFELQPAPDVIQGRGREVMWLKERLINLAIAQLPPQAQKVAWLDGDILLSNPEWAVEPRIFLTLWRNMTTKSVCATGQHPEPQSAAISRLSTGAWCASPGDRAHLLERGNEASH